jgi:16S rRNA (cytidine1402-2'-O)-methyltransferase
MQRMEPGLYIVGTPIGNLGDLSLRAQETLREVHLICAEDTRHTKRLTQRYEINTPLMSCHKFNEAQRSETIIARIQNGEAIALVSDSGMPTISDPGARLITACREANLLITSIPGPTALTTALACSGLSSTGFTFIGFLPPKSGGRERELKRWSDHPLPVLFYESPYRLLKLMGEIETHLGAERIVFVARELTKLHEEFLQGTPTEITAQFTHRNVKGELVIILHPLSSTPTKNKQTR